MPPTAFKFRFGALLKYRKRIFDRLSLELAELRRDMLKRQAELSELQRRHSTCTADLATRVAGKVDPELVMMYHRYLDLLSGRMQHVGEEITRLNSDVLDKTDQIIAASKKKKIVEKIRERDMFTFSKLVADTERKILDEVGANRASAIARDASRAEAPQIT
jgi:flagellar FliJ protein